jgi:hypothetical protein
VTSAAGAGGPEEPRAQTKIFLLEGATVQHPPENVGPAFRNQVMYPISGKAGKKVWLDDEYLSRHVLFLGGIGTGKSNAMYLLLEQLRLRASQDDVFIIFDTKGDFQKKFCRAGDAVISNTPDQDPGGVRWNLFRDLLTEGSGERAEQIHEIATTVFSAGLDRAGDNAFFAMAARDVFAAVVEAMCRDGKAHSNADLRANLEKSIDGLMERLQVGDTLDPTGVARYLQGDKTPDSIVAFLQQTLGQSFSGVFGQPGDFSVRNFVRQKGGRALFVEYDIASGSRLLPVYRVLIDMAIKEALGLGRPGARGSVYFVLDEFALLPKLSHIANGINFGRSLGLKFLVGTQNVSQVLDAYGSEVGPSILSGFGTVFAFRLTDDRSRDLVRQRFGSNRKQVSTYAHVRSAGVQQLVVTGNVIEDWTLSSLLPGQCVAALPDGGPFYFAFEEYPVTRP